MANILLSGPDWHCGAATRLDACDLSQVDEWLPAAVPGDVRLALLANGRIPDPFFGLNNEESRWVEDYDWWYKRDLPLPALEGKRAHLVFEGIDYIADIYLNGTKLGHHEGMFARQVYEVTRILRESNTLAVRLLAASKLPKIKLNRRERLRKWLAKTLFWADLFPDRLASLKCQMGYGWDFAPRMLTSGIWDDVYLHRGDTVYIQDVFVRSDSDGEEAVVRVRAELDSAEEIDCEMVARVEGANFDLSPLTFRRPISLPSGKTVRELAFRIASPRIWQTWDRGTPHLYRLELEIRRNKSLLDSRETTFGIRSIELVANQSAPRGSADLTFVVNGQREFIRGANWVPADSLFARVKGSDYAGLISMAKSAHVNMLRVWGGGLREKKAFYDLCDAEGILVWQEFPLACAFFDYYPSDDSFVELTAQEAEGIVRHLRNHPSLAVWCGGNEFVPDKNQRLVRAIKRVVEGSDGTRPFRPSSPGQGDGHNWQVWHGKANLRDYRVDKSLLGSEFGLQALPCVQSLARFLSEDALYPPGEQWEYHNAQMDKLNRYAAPFGPRDLPTLVEATQKAQAQGLQVAIEHFRRRKGRTSGTLFWQLDEPWPSICWSVIDYFRQPKLAYDKLKDVYNPVLISLRYPLKKYGPGDSLSAEIWAINDLLQPFETCDLRLFLGDKVVHSQSISLPPDSCRLVGKIKLPLAVVGELRVELTRNGEAVSRNSYDLGYFDPVEIGRSDAIRHWIAWRVFK